MNGHSAGTASDGYRVRHKPHDYRPSAPDWGMRPRCTDCGQPKTDHERGETR